MSQTPTTLLDLVEEGFSRNTTGVVAATKRDGRWIETPLADFRRQAELDRVNEELPPWEQVNRFTLLRRPWSVEGGELTPTLNIKRRLIHEKHAGDIQSMYR